MEFMDYVMKQLEAFDRLPAAGKFFWIAFGLMITVAVVTLIVGICKRRRGNGFDTGHPPT